MSEVASGASAAGSDMPEPLVLLFVLLLLLLDLGRRPGEALAGTVGSIRLARPRLVPLGDAERVAAVGLLGGIVADALRGATEKPPP